MPAVSYTAVIERAEPLRGQWATEPYEAAWAREAIFFVVARRPIEGDLVARVQISPDGRHWVDDGSVLRLRQGEDIGFVRVERFGGWLRLAGQFDEPLEAHVLIYIALKE